MGSGGSGGEGRMNLDMQPVAFKALLGFEFSLTLARLALYNLNLAPSAFFFFFFALVII
jgi:hypothetical protein